MESYLSCQEDEVGLLVSEVVKKQQNYVLKVFECSLEAKCKSQKVSLAFHPATFNMDGHDKSRISEKKITFACLQTYNFNLSIYIFWQ